MKKLTIGDFTREDEQGSFNHRFYHKLDDGREISLEACMCGYCVGLYDEDLNLIGEKVCTNIEGMGEVQIFSRFSMGTDEALNMAIEIANDLLARANEE